MADGGNKIRVSDLLAIAHVVEDNESVIIEVNCADEYVDDAPAECRIVGIAFADLVQPRTDFCFGEAKLLRDAKMGEIRFGIGFLCLKKLHLLVDFFVGNFRGFGKGIDEVIQFAVNALDDALVFDGLAIVKLLVEFLYDGLCDDGGA